MSDTQEAGTALTRAETTNFALVFVPGGVEATIQRIEREARELAEKLDVSSVKGRAARVSLGNKVARSKTAIDDGGKALNESKRAEINLVDADRRLARQRLDDLKAEIIAPVEAYKKAESDRIKANEDAILAMKVLVDGLDGLMPDEIQARAASLQPFDWSVEFKARAEKVRAGVLAQLRVAYTDAVQREADIAAEIERAARQREQDRLDAIEAKRVREEQIAHEAAEAARVAAEVEAERKAREVAEQAQAQLQAAEALRVHQAKEAARKEAEAAEALAEERRRAQEAADRMERGRVLRHERAIAEIEDAAHYPGHPPSVHVQARIESVCAGWGGVDADWQEFAEKAATARANTIHTLSKIRDEAIHREVAEAEKLRTAAAMKAERDAQAAVEAERERASKERQRVDYHRSMLQHVKNCGFGFIGPDPQPIGILQYELTDKIKYDEENFGDLLSEALIARNAALAMLQRSQDESNRRHTEEAERQRVAKAEAVKKAEDDRRAADEDHRRAINREIVFDLMRHCQWPEGTPLAEALARKIVTAVARNEIRNMRITY